MMNKKHRNQKIESLMYMLLVLWGTCTRNIEDFQKRAKIYAHVYFTERCGIGVIGWERSD